MFVRRYIIIWSSFFNTTQYSKETIESVTSNAQECVAGFSVSGLVRKKQEYIDVNGEL